MNTRRVAVGSSAWLGQGCKFIHAAQEQLCVTEVREHPNRTLSRQMRSLTVCRHSDKRNADAATCPSIPHTVADVNSAAKAAVSVGRSLHGQPDDGFTVQRIIA